KKKYFLYVGNAYPHKNLERLIDAFSQIIAKDNSAKLVLVGKEDYFYKKLKQNISVMKVSNSIIFFGEANDRELSWLYSNAIALVFPSLMEGFGLPAIEAMENKCLLLVSDIPVFKEICKDVPFYFDPYNTHDIAEKMAEVYSESSKYQDKIKLGIERAKDFSWKKMAQETLQVYSSVL
ncbi:MAG: glycosyltransferase family 1 protein, partial [bacterium]|nr:glycosyltransferase family 1 protein [bacterium]